MPKPARRASPSAYGKRTKNKQVIYSPAFKSFIAKNRGDIKSFLYAIKKLPDREGASIQEGNVQATFLKNVKNGSTYKVTVGGRNFFVKRFGEFTRPIRGPWESEIDVDYMERLGAYELHPTALQLFEAAKRLQNLVAKINLPKGYKVRIIEPYFGFNNKGNNFFVSKYYSLKHFSPQSKIEKQAWAQLNAALEKQGFKDTGLHNMFFNEKTKTIYLFDIL